MINRALLGHVHTRTTGTYVIPYNWADEIRKTKQKVRGKVKVGVLAQLPFRARELLYCLCCAVSKTLPPPRLAARGTLLKSRCQGNFRVDGVTTFQSCDNIGGGESSPGKGGAVFNGNTGSILFAGGVNILDTSLTVTAVFFFQQYLVYSPCVFLSGDRESEGCICRSYQRRSAAFSDQDECDG